MKRIYITESQYNRVFGAKGFATKESLSLKEGIDANIGTANGVQQAIVKAKETMSRNPNVTSASADAGKIDGQADQGGSEDLELKIPSNAQGSTISKVDNIVRQQDKDDMKVTITKPVSPNNTSPEMTTESLRRNSAEFTKKEFKKMLQML